MEVRPATAPSHASGRPPLPCRISTRKPTMIAVIAAMPESAVALRSILAKRSSRPSPRRPRIVSLRPPRGQDAEGGQDPERHDTLAGVAANRLRGEYQHAS